MTDATDRAIALMREATEKAIPVWQANAAVRALLADPALLADLALEAGGLEQFADCGHCAGREDCKYDDSHMLSFTVDCEPVYRRKEKNSG